MSFKGRLLVFGYPLLEIVTAYAVAMWIGWGWTLLLVLAGFPAGFAIMRNAGDAAMRDLQRAAQTGTEPDAGRHGLTFVGGLLIMIPGFVTDVLGLLLVLPPTQHLFRAKARTWIEGRVTTVRMPGVAYPSGDVIQGTVVQETVVRPEPREGGPGELTS